MPTANQPDASPEYADPPAGSHPIGERCGTGTYRCVSCNSFEVLIRDPEDQLPPCDNCGSGPNVRYLPMDENARISGGMPNRDQLPPKPR